MKKKSLIMAGVLVVILIILFIYTFIISFKIVKQNTDNINLVYKDNFQKIVKIPNEIPPSLRSFDVTKYTWEMITREQEVSTVIFTHETGFDRNQDTIHASLEMSQGGDPSLFIKVLPAVLSDSQTMDAVGNLEDPNLGPNDEIGYKTIVLDFGAPNSTQITKIIWEFDRNRVDKNTETYFNSLYQYPLSIIRFLYGLQRSALIILAP